MSELTLPEKIENEDKTIRFLNGLIPDHKGRFVTDYFAMTEKEMEDSHDWIQHAFPIDTISPHNPEAPLYFGIMKYNYEGLIVQARLAEKYLNSIGLYTDIKHDQYNNPTSYVRMDNVKFYNIINRPFNHHLKRISRLLKHLTLSSRNPWLPKAIFQTLLKSQFSNVYIPVVFHNRTLAYWSAIVLEFDLDSE